MGFWAEVLSEVSKDVTDGAMGVVGTKIVGNWINLLIEREMDKLNLSIEKFIKTSSFDEIKRIHHGIVSRLSLNMKNDQTKLLLLLHFLYCGELFNRFEPDDFLDMMLSE